MGLVFFDAQWFRQAIEDGCCANLVKHELRISELKCTQRVPPGYLFLDSSSPYHAKISCVPTCLELQEKSSVSVNSQ